MRDVGDRLAANLEQLDPLTASEWGATSSDLPAFDPDWFEARAELSRSALAELTEAPDDIDADVIRERATTELDWIASGEAYCELQAALDSPLFRIRHCFDNMPTATTDDWRTIAERLERVPAALRGFTRTLDAFRHAGPRAAASQVEASAAAAASWADSGGGRSVFHELANSRPESSGTALGESLSSAADGAAAAFDDMAAFLRGVYLPSAPEREAVGSERFAIWSRRYAGDVIGRDDYDFAAARLDETMRELEDLRTSAAVSGASPTITGEAEFIRWAEQQLEIARRRLPDIVTVDVPPIAIRVQPDGATYYAPAAEDGSSPATVWVGGGDGPHHVEYDKTVLFHESIPGHHLESSAQRHATHLSRFQRTVYIPAHSEGWGLYAEGLAEEIGLIDTAHARLGCRGSQALRLVSLLVDVGLHTELRPPAGLRELVGETWTVPGATRAIASVGLDNDVASWWIVNMIGRPAHRASYAAGERAMLDARRAATSRNATLPTFHTELLAMGPMGLAQLRRASRTHVR